MRVLKLFLAAMGATMLLGVLVPSASARNFSWESQTFRAAYRELSFIALETTTSCQVTLEGSLHARTFAKTIGSLIGYITSATLGPCTSGTFTILRETLPWHVRFSGFTGKLPEITSIIVHVIGLSWRIRNIGVTCLIRSIAPEPVIQRIHIDPTTSSATGISTFGAIRTGAECANISGEFASDNPVPTVAGSAAGIHIRLI
jgi:hypothetical protein